MDNTENSANPTQLFSGVRIKRNYKGELEPSVHLSVTDDGIVGKEHLDDAVAEARERLVALAQAIDELS